MRSICAAVCFLLVAIPCAAQGSAFGLGARLSMVRSDAHSDLDPVRFTGGHIRLRGSSRTGFEVSLDVHSQRRVLQDNAAELYRIDLPPVG